MACVDRAWHRDDHNIHVYESVAGYNIHLFNNNICDTNVRLINGTDASDYIRTEPAAAEVVFTCISNDKYDAADFCSHRYSYTHYARIDGCEQFRSGY